VGKCRRRFVARRIARRTCCGCAASTPSRSCAWRCTDSRRIYDQTWIVERHGYQTPSGHQSGTARAAPDRRMNQPRGVSQLWTATFSSGFRSAVVGDQKYEFTKKQAEVVEVLFEAFESGLHKMHQDEIMGSVDSSQRIGQLFHGHPAYGTLISGDHNGYYWLAL
jgi:hypothetical protein